MPDVKGPLLKEVPTVSIIEANKEVKKAIDQPLKKRKGTTYIKITPEVKAKIAKFAVENGNCAAAGKYNKGSKEHLNESTVFSQVSTYNSEMECKRESGEDDLVVKVLPLAKRDRPLLIGETIYNRVKAYL